MSTSPAPSHMHLSTESNYEKSEFWSSDPGYAPSGFIVKMAENQAPARYRQDELPFRGESAGRADRAYMCAERCFDLNAGRLVMCNLVPGAALALWVLAAGIVIYLVIASSLVAAYTVLGVTLLGIAALAAWREAGMTIIAVDGIDSGEADWKAALWGPRTAQVLATVFSMYLCAAVALVPFVAPAAIVLYQLMFAPAIAAHRGVGPLAAMRASWSLVSANSEDARRAVINFIPNRHRRAYKDFRRFAWLALPLIPSASYLLLDREVGHAIETSAGDPYINR